MWFTRVIHQSENINSPSHLENYNFNTFQRIVRIRKVNLNFKLSRSTIINNKKKKKFKHQFFCQYKILKSKPLVIKNLKNC